MVITSSKAVRIQTASTRGPALHVIEAKGLDASDRQLRKAIAYKVVQVMTRMEKRGEVSRAGKREGAVMWQGPIVGVR